MSQYRPQLGDVITRAGWGAAKYEVSLIRESTSHLWFLGFEHAGCSPFRHETMAYPLLNDWILVKPSKPYPLHAPQPVQLEFDF